MPQIGPVHHISLTVTDLDASCTWYQDLLGLSTMMDEEHDGGHAVVLADFDAGLFLGLHRHDGSNGDRFDETRTGLDHVAISVPSRDVLADWVRRLDAAGIEHSEISDQPWGSLIAFRDPDNIQLEFCSPPTA